MRENSAICCKVVSSVLFSPSHLRAVLMFGVVSGVLGGLSMDAFAAPTFFPFWINSKGVINMPNGVGVAWANTGNPILDTPTTGLGYLENRMYAPPFGNPGHFNATPTFSRIDWGRWTTDVRPLYANGKPNFNFGADVDNWRNSHNDRGGGFNSHPEQPAASVVPAPGAILLGSIGTCLVGWLRRRKSL